MNFTIPVIGIISRKDLREMRRIT